MSNVVPIGLPKRPNLSHRQGALVRSFASHRRAPTDVFWLKENAELLNVLSTGGARIAGHDLAVYGSFYDTLEERLRFFPQYYRFLLSICLDLEDLGHPGDKGSTLCRRVTEAKLAESELSDLQRAEAQRLLARRGYGAPEAGLDARLRNFMEHPEAFALPNKKLAYELVHIVFYLSEYGAHPLALSAAALTSLEYAGLLAFLDQDIDLLSEVCVALRFGGQTPSAIWEDWLAQEMRGFALTPAPDGPVSDAYHEYLVSSWWAGIAGFPAFMGASPRAGGIQITRFTEGQSPLRVISETMYHLGSARSGDWSEMRGVLSRSIADAEQEVLEKAVSSSDHFGRFFAEFARA